ncbi:DUF1990 family protein [Amorphoplanes digitatis]|uniref:Uncharacterized protein (UPF0548 family) n=1 Tax=Actinoplanes digitatis TaxID=1868 RepID=A0A7W7MP27_9ACTN|nr:DUF1990 domain-containing protein [Actinoplanes digitatis]MBB4760939.1 uncharacterized protein (UPF0548 family) [Actinoplanes digitatis]GID95250.1 DUF1990 domain-containing protein [Actinoplanes digitatis]
MSGFTYAEVGATRHEPLPTGYRHLHYRTELGRDDFAAAADAILTLRMHRATGARIRTDADRAAPGVRLTVGLGPLVAPCEVVWAATGTELAGFGYGTLPGHQVRGEESFTVERDADGRVWFTVTAFSAPARLPMRLAGPVAVLGQHLYARICGRALRRLCARSRTVGM